MSEVAKWSIGPALGVAVLTLLAVLNFTAPVEAQSLLALAEAPMCDFTAIRGGVDWVGAIDTGCALAGIGSLFFVANPYGMAFCAGWALGRVIDNYFL
jgi:hypothetical protein